MRRRELTGRLLLALAGVVAGVLLLEAGLQVLALAVGRPERALPERRAAGSVRVACIGDSNTYGLWLEREEAWPARLEARWNEQPGAKPFEVVNLGVPGANTSHVLRDLPRMLEATEPQLVLLMLGVNDYWTRPAPLAEADPADAASATTPRGPWLLRHSILYELWRLAIRSRDSRALPVEVSLRETKTPGKLEGEGVLRIGDVELDVGYAQGQDASERGDSGALLANLETLARRLREREIPLYLLTYPARWDFYRAANDHIRLAAQQSGTPLVDLEPLFASRCPQRKCPDWFFADLHPTASGYDVVAGALVERLRRDGR
jgi:lysophospholipase L1-like esterase